jgi:alpha-D-ribose 1-methylphosphonate 5-triphosphate synthase subunit PhnI
MTLDKDLAREIEATIERYHDAMPQGQGDPGSPDASKAIALEMARLLYDNSETIADLASEPQVNPCGRSVRSRQLSQGDRGCNRAPSARPLQA